jgi:uncharacterized protein with HEPN domain
MLDHAEEAVAMAKDHSRADLDANRQLSLALTRLMEVVGEAANRVPIEIREEIKEIPWAGVVGLRNRLIHGYDEVDHDILWEVVTSDLLPLVEALKAHSSENG